MTLSKATGAAMRMFRRAFGVRISGRLAQAEGASSTRVPAAPPSRRAEKHTETLADERADERNDDKTRIALDMQTTWPRQIERRGISFIVHPAAPQMGVSFSND